MNELTQSHWLETLFYQNESSEKYTHQKMYYRHLKESGI